jgi:putative PIN family toxin of toxin-antitoxin system
VRIVIDTNVLISAIFWTGKPKQLLNKARRREIIFLTSETVLKELKEVLTRGDKPFNLSAEEAERVVEEIRGVGEIIQTHSRITVCKDEMDNRVIECAVDGGAECIISGDMHLLELKLFKGVNIITVSEFLKYLEKKTG